MSADKKENGNKPGDTISGTLNVSVSAQHFNLLVVSHTGEEFLFDLFQRLPGLGSASFVGRYVTSVAHARRIYDALRENIETYESAFGRIVQAESGG